MSPAATISALLLILFAGIPLLQRVDYQHHPVFKTLGFMAICSVICASVMQALPMFPLAVVRQATISSGALFSGLCVAGSLSPEGKFDDFSGILSVSFLIVFAASLANIFAPPHVTIFENIFAYLGIPVVSGLTLLASNDLRRNAASSAATGQTFDPINSVLPLLMSLVNIFNMFLSINSRKKQ